MIFERFTDGARLAYAIANQMAGEFNHTEVLPEHLCYGVLSRPEARLSASLEAMKINAAKLKATARNVLRRGSRNGPWGKQPLATVTKQIFQTAVDEADSLGHVEVNSTHVLLALLKTPTEPSAEVLSTAGLTAEALRSVIRRLFPPSPLTDGAQLEEESAAKHREALREHEQRVEKERKDRLLRQQTSDWQYAKLIRSFVEEVNRTASNRGISIAVGSQLDTWLKWVADQAIKLDPIPGLISSHVD